MTGGGSPAAGRWTAALAGWAIPDEILRSAPESPWVFPPGLFRAADRSPSPADFSWRRGRDALGEGGTVLDVGCGGGAAGLALVPPARLVVGVDRSPAMLAGFTRAAGERGVECRAVPGQWPEVADSVASADVVVCHHVVYNVSEIDPFVRGLAAHARRRVVVELPDRHPSVSLRALWAEFWGLPRPDGPSADMFVEVVREAGFEPRVDRRVRPVSKARLGPEYVAFVRRRLCLDASRDDEIRAALGAGRAVAPVAAVTVWWDGPSSTA